MGKKQIGDQLRPESVERAGFDGEDVRVEVEQGKQVETRKKKGDRKKKEESTTTILKNEKQAKQK